MKKTLALVLAIAMVFSTITVAFAAEPVALSADAQICSDLGMLKGSTGTVDAAYVATAPTRIQAAVMFLRLKGLEAEATAFTGDANFADASKAAWAKPIMAYLKANPQLGWAGDGTNFNPTNMVTAKEYYKVLLETLGYKQNTAEVVGDFTWDNVVEFAAGKGLTKVAAVTNYTVNDLAVATVEALKLNVKDTTKTLVASLVEAGKVDAAKATAAGIYTAAAATAAKIDVVKATANDKIEVAFDADVDKAFAETAANYKIVVKGSTTTLEVKEAKLVGTDMVALTTAAQTGGTAYTMTVGEVSKNFAGLAKVTGILEIDTVKCIDTETVELIFKKAVDRASAEDVANYVINNGVTVKKAEVWVDQDDSRRTVKLTTEGIANNKVYQLKIQNVKSADLATIKTVTKSFTGKKDTKAPTIKSFTVVNNQRLKLVLTDDHGVNQAVAENLESYAITAGSDTLKINSVEAKDVDLDDYGYLEVIEINTDSMTAGTSYKLSINNMVDGSVAANAISKPITKDFKGVSVDKTAPKVSTVTALSDDLVEIVFQDTNRIEGATLTDINNYAFDKDITPVAAKIVRTADLDNNLAKTVLLETTSMEKNKVYKLTISNVADEFGNVVTTTTRSVVGIEEDIKPATVTSTVFVDKNTVQVWFDERLDSETANDPANYSLSGGIGTVIKASLSGTKDYKRVTLTVPELTANKTYTITINGVKDRVGNTMTDVKASVIATRTSIDNEKPTIASIDVLSKREVRVTFDEMVNPNATAITTTYVDNNGVVQPGPTFNVAGKAIDGETTVVYYANADMVSNREYTIATLTAVTDKAANSYVLPTDKPKFYGTNADNVKAEISTIEQTDARTIRVTFTKPVMLSDGNGFTLGVANGTVFERVDEVGPPANTSVAWDQSSGARNFDATVDPDGANTTEGESTVDFVTTNSAKMSYDVVYGLDFSAVVVDYMGIGVKDEEDTDTVTNKKTTFRSYMEDTDGPVIDYVEAVNLNTIKVVYNENIKDDAEADLGTYKIMDSDAKNNIATSTNHRLDADNDNIVFFTTNINLTKDTAYTLKPVVGARDIADNLAKVTDVEFTFIGSAVEVANFLTGVDIRNTTKIRVKATTEFQAAGTNSIVVAELDDNGDVVTGSGANLFAGYTLPGDDNTVAFEFGDDWKTAEVTLKQAVKANTTYKVTATMKNGEVLSVKFGGLVDNGGITFYGSLLAPNDDVITFSGWNINDYVVKVVYTTESGVYTATTTPVAGADIAAGKIDLTDILTTNGATRLQKTGAVGLGAAVPAGAKVIVEIHRYDTVAGAMEAAALYTGEITR